MGFISVLNAILEGQNNYQNLFSEQLQRPRNSGGDLIKTDKRNQNGLLITMKLRIFMSS
jgi:hypothetical protein